MTRYKRIIHDLLPPMAWRIARKMLQRAKAVTSNPKPDGNWLIQQKNQSALGIFVHIHKCAGSSLVQAFIDNPHVISCIARPGIFPGRTGREKIPDELFDRCMKFTIVRNPYARLVSAYRMFKSSVRWEPLFPTFDDFVDFIQWTDVHEHEVKNEISIDDFMKRTEYIVHHCSSFHNPKYMIDQMDYVGRIETLNEDLKKIAEMLNIAPIQVNHLNKRGQAYNYRDYYSTNSKNLVGKIYQRDIERFKYQF